MTTPITRRTVVLAAAAVGVAWVFPALADDVAVPIPLQAELLAKVSKYDRSIAERAGAEVVVLVVHRKGMADSERVAAQMVRALGDTETIAGLPHREISMPYASAASLVDTCKAKRASVLYLAPGLGDEIAALAAALSGLSLLSVASVASYVPVGVVLGFDLVSSKPTLLVNLAQAKRQRVQLSADLLKLAKVYP